MSSYQAPVICDYCGKDARLVHSGSIYPGSNYGYMWQCKPCGAYVGCHSGTKRPLGRLANGKLRYWKKKAHKAFDPIWQSGIMGRKSAYKWLAGEMKLAKKDCHIGMFNVDECSRVVALCESRGDV